MGNGQLLHRRLTYVAPVSGINHCPPFLISPREDLLINPLYLGVFLKLPFSVTIAMINTTYTRSYLRFLRSFKLFIWVICS